MSKHLVTSLVVLFTPFAHADECRGDLTCVSGGIQGAPSPKLNDMPETRPALNSAENNEPLNIVPPAQKAWPSPPSMPHWSPPNIWAPSASHPPKPPAERRSLAAECVQHLTGNGYSVGADFIAICREVRNSNGVSAVGSVAGRGQEIDSAKLRALIRIETSFGWTCVQDFVGNGYAVTADLAQACGQVGSAYASRAITSVTYNGQPVDRATLIQLAAVNRSEALEAIQELSGNNYRIGESADLVRAIRRFHGPNGVRALKSLAYRGQRVDVRTIEQLAALD